MPFLTLGLSPSLARNALNLGYTNPTPIQTQAIPVVLSGRDLVATAQTGTGKTAAFLLPILHGLLTQPRGSTRALILTPTRELAQQIHEVFRGLAAGTQLRSALVIGGVPSFPQARDLRAGIDVVVATPGRLLDHLDGGAFRPNGRLCCSRQPCRPRSRALVKRSFAIPPAFLSARRAHRSVR